MYLNLGVNLVIIILLVGTLLVKYARKCGLELISALRLQHIWIHHLKII